LAIDQAIDVPPIVIEAGAADAFTQYDWPGNIRELQNVLERSVILTNGSTRHVAMPELMEAAGQVR
jgi:DNA-binding NtrC family response regulator